MSFVFFFIREEYLEKYINHIGFTGDSIYFGDLSLLNSSGASQISGQAVVVVHLVSTDINCMGVRFQ